MNFLYAIIQGVIEGITEWLPISSTGHMVLTDDIIEKFNIIDLEKDFIEMFLVVIQLGAILAVVLLFWNKLWPFHLKNKQVVPYFKVESSEKGNCFKKFCNDYIYVEKFILWFKIRKCGIITY